MTGARLSEAELKLYRGVWCIYERKDGKSVRRSLRTSDRAEAMALFAETRAVEKSREKNLIPFSEIWSRYRASLGDRPAAKTMAYEGKSILRTFGALRPAAITTDLCHAYKRLRETDGKKPGTIRTELTRVRSALNWAASEGLIDKAPTIARPSQPPPRDRYLTRDEAKRLIDTCDTPHIKTFVVLALTTGARMAAILELEWNQIDFEAGLITLTKPNARETAKRRAVLPMNARCRKELEDAQARSTCTHVVEFRGAPVASVKTAFNAVVRRAGLKDVSPHVLRHTAAVLLAEAGRPMSEVSQFLGHSSTAVTEKIYARFSPHYLRQTASALDF